MNPEDIAATALVFISAPVKPGSLHRLQIGWDYEARIAEVAMYCGAVREAFERGRQLWRGERDTRSISLGGIIRSYALKAFDKIGEEPLIGLLASLTVSSSLLGYSEAAQEKPSPLLPRFIQYALYRSLPVDALNLLEALEAVGASSYVLQLDSRGINRRTIELQSLPLGELFEALSSIDSGFWLNLRSYSSVLRIAREASRAGSLVEASLATYGLVADALGVKVNSSLPVREALKIDMDLRRKGVNLHAALGGALAAVLIAYAENPGLRVTPSRR